MSSTESIPITTGRQRWPILVARERIIYEMRALILEATADPKANFPEFHDWARDLRRGRTNILGGFLRLTDSMQRRGMGQQGRRLALKLLDLGHAYVNLVLPEQASPARMEPVPVRFLRPVGRRAA